MRQMDSGGAEQLWNRQDSSGAGQWNRHWNSIGAGQQIDRTVETGHKSGETE